MFHEFAFLPRPTKNYETEVITQRFLFFTVILVWIKIVSLLRMTTGLAPNPWLSESDDMLAINFFWHSFRQNVVSSFGFIFATSKSRSRREKKITTCDATSLCYFLLSLLSNLFCFCIHNNKNVMARGFSKCFQVIVFLVSSTVIESIQKEINECKSKWQNKFYRWPTQKDNQNDNCKYQKTSR